MAKQSPLQQQASGRSTAFRAVIAVLTLISAYLVFEFGRISAGYDTLEVGNVQRAYDDRIVQLESQIAELKQEVALLETNREVDRESYGEVESSLSALQAKIHEQRDAIAFYRGIVSPSDGNSGLRVQDLTLTRGKEEREFNIRLVLVQAMKHDLKVSGDVNLTIAGRQDDVDTSYVFNQLLPANAERNWPFSFRYFQNFDRLVVLPDGFTPERITVEVRSRTRSISSIEESFVWAAGQG